MRIEWLFTPAPRTFGLIPGWACLTGWAILFILIIMAICSLPFVRRRGSFEVTLLLQTIFFKSNLFLKSIFYFLGVLLDSSSLRPVLDFVDCPYASFLDLVCSSWFSFFSWENVSIHKSMDWSFYDYNWIGRRLLIPCYSSRH